MSTEIKRYASEQYVNEAINEAIELSKKYSDEAVTKMINGVLDKIYHEVEK